MRSVEQRQASYRYGIAAEQLAAWYLRCKGYRILSTRYRNTQGEIDLLAQRGRTLVAVEVKARRNFEQCEIAVAPWKQQKIARATEAALATLAGAHQLGVRFDVIWIVPWRWPRHLKDAWRL